MSATGSSKPITILRRTGSPSSKYQSNARTPRRAPPAPAEEGEYVRENFKPLVPRETFTDIRRAVMEFVNEQDALLTAFCSVESLRAMPDQLHKLAIVCPRQQNLNDFAATLVSRVNSLPSASSREFKAEFRPAEHDSRFGSLFIVTPSRDIFFGTLSDFPVFKDVVDTLDLDLITWRPKVMFGGQEWYPRQLVPLLLRKAMIAAGSLRVVADLDEVLAQREESGLLLPTRQTEQILEAIGAPPPVAVSASLPPSSTLVMPPLHTYCARPVAFGGDPLARISDSAWKSLAAYTEVLIEAEHLPRLYVAFPMEWDFVGLEALHRHARQIRAQYRAVNPGRDLTALDAYISAASNPQLHYALWTLFLLPVITIREGQQHPLAATNF
jgi:hypothetical protein